VSLRTAAHAPLVLHGRRLVLRTVTENDYEGWLEVRTRCRDWLQSGSPVRETPRTSPRIAVRSLEMCHS
jgi:hypothetical protein